MEEQRFNSWSELNRILRETRHSKEVFDLLQSAVSLKVRAQIVDRLYQRYSKLRYQEECASLREGVFPSSIRRTGV